VRRQEQAEATRQAILDAGRALFVERGYAKTTVADIAAAAGVAVPTVYVSVGPKPAILDALRSVIPVAAAVPDNAAALISQTDDPRELLAAFAAGMRRLMETSGDLMFAIESAAPFEAVAADAWEEGMVIHRATCGMIVDRLEALGVLTTTLPSAHAANVLSLLSLPATWRVLGRDDGWSYDEIERWIVDTAMASITTGSAPTRVRRRPNKTTRV
jgi:AcrR family transcriptional regulator